LIHKKREDMREISYAQAINEGLWQAMELSSDVFVMGQLVDYEPGIFGQTVGLANKFGKERVLDFPVAENVMTSTAMGSALAGMRPVVCHQRLDFMMYSMDQIVNWLSLWYFKSNGKSNMPVTICAVVGKGWGQGPQHSKNLHSWFAHLPGIKVAIPATPHDAKGLLMESIFGESPVIIISNRSLFSMVGPVAEIPYRVKFGRAAIRRTGKDVTLIAIGSLVPISLRVAEQLSGEIDIEVIDIRTVSPIDRETILKSVSKTKRIVVCDPSWQSVSVAAEILAIVGENFSCELKANFVRICLPDSHTPMSYTLEEKYYVNESMIIEKIKKMF
jgi:acetoin:2,6-dichlorophenolindophenol oxidoreductase subunit beta